MTDESTPLAAPVAAGEPKETKTKTVWVAWTNTDLTEGRGVQYPFAVCDSQTTALRIGAKKYVMGSDCPVDARVAVFIDHEWLVPGMIRPPTEEDTKLDEKRAEKSAALQRLKNAGVSDADLKLLGAI
jgi:hypothetical protein